MSMELVPVGNGSEAKFEVEIACRCCEGSGIQVRVPVVMMGDGPFRELTVQDELRRQSYETYAKRLRFPWWKRLSREGIFFASFLVCIAIWMAGFRVLFSWNEKSVFLWFVGVFGLAIVWPLCVPQVMRVLRGEGHKAWEKDRAKAQAMYEQILREYGEITEPDKVVIWISGETETEAIKGDSILVMLVR